MEMPVLIVVGEWRSLKEDDWEFIPEKGKFGRCVCVKDHMTYTELTCTVCEVFNLNPKNINPKISYWMPGMMSSMIESKRPPVYVDNQISLDTFISIRRGDPSVSMYVSFRPFVDAIMSTTEDEAMLVKLDEEDVEVEADGEEKKDVGSEGEDEDYDVNKWDDSMIRNYEIGNVAEVGAHVRTIGEFTSLLAMCSKRQPNVVEEGQNSGEYIEIQQEGSDDLVDKNVNIPLTYTSENITYTNTEDQQRNTVKASYGVYKEFPLLYSSEAEKLFGTDPSPVFDDLANVRHDTDAEICSTGETLYVGSVFGSREALQNTMSVTAIKGCFCYNQIRSNPKRVEFVCVDRSCPWRLTATVVRKSENFKIIQYVCKHTCDINSRKKYGKHATYKVVAQIMKDRYSSTQQGPRAVELPHLMLNEMNVRISYAKAWRAKEVAVDHARGDELKSYKFLPTYLFLLRKANPGTIYHLHSTPEVDGTSRFKYLFVSLGASI